MNKALPTHFDLRAAQIDRERLAARLVEKSSQKTPRVAVIGDFCLDKYLYVYPDLDETSVETRLIAYQARARRIFAGAGGTIAGNLSALGADVSCFGVIGDDGEGYDLLRALKRLGADVDGMIATDSIMTATYMKPMRPRAEAEAGRRQAPDEGEWIEGNRYDIRNLEPASQRIVDQLKTKIEGSVSQFDAVVVSDQFPPGSETLFSSSFREFLAQTARSNPDVFFLCDSRFFINEYRDALVKCNANELFDAFAVGNGGFRKRETTLDSSSETRETALCEAGVWLAQRNNRPVLVTRGASGSILIERGSTGGYNCVSIPSNKVEPPIDICGAGDATNASLAYSRALGFDLIESSYLAGVASSITIKQLGVTGTATVRQILDVLRAK